MADSAYQYVREQDAGLDARTKASRASSTKDKCHYMRQAVEHLSKAYKLCDDVEYQPNIALMCAKEYDKLATLLHEMHGSDDEIGKTYKSAISHCDLVMHVSLHHRKADSFNSTVGFYMGCTTRALEHAKSMSPKQGVWMAESYLEVMKQDDEYPHVRFMCYWYIARIWKNAAWKLLYADIWDFAKAMQMLRHAKQAAMTAKELVSNMPTKHKEELAETEHQIEDYIKVAKAMQKIENAKVLLEEVQYAKSGKKEIAHEAIDLYRSAATMAEGKHTGCMKKALEGIGNVYKDVLRDCEQAQKYYNKAGQCRSRDK